MRRNAFFSPARIFVIASHTFTHLVRMKVFYFMGIFAVLMLAASFFEMPWSRTTEDSAEQELIVLKSTAMGAMAMFSVLFAIAATALLIPKDLEDRTLYTILSKPVPRLDYLIGKLAGVLILVTVSLLLMNGMLSVILHFKTEELLLVEMAKAEAHGWPAEHLESRLSAVAQQGVTWTLQAGIGAILFKAMVMASLALLISTFSSSTLFTIVIAVVIYFMGHFTEDARNYWLHSQSGGVSKELKLMTQAIALIFPDFQLYNIIDSTIEGKKVPQGIFARLAVLTLFYSGIYSVLAWFTFRKKEF